MKDYNFIMKPSYIYCIRNTINNKIYIGKSNNVKIRWSKHKSCTDKYSVLTKAIKKYGIENFELTTLEECENEEIAFCRESWYILFLNSKGPYGYNLDSGGRGGKELSESTKYKISLASKNRKHSSETKQKMSEKQKGKNHPMFGKQHTLESKNKMSTSHKHSEKSIEQQQKNIEFFNLHRPDNTKYYIIHDKNWLSTQYNQQQKSIYAIAKEVGCSVNAVFQSMKKFGFTFRTRSLATKLGKRIK